MIARLTALALACVALLPPSVAMTQDVTIYMLGEELNNDCRIFLEWRRNNNRIRDSKYGLLGGICYGFVVGVMDHYEGLSSINAISGDPQPAFCAKGVNGNDATEAVALYLDQHPEERREVGYWLVRKILAEKFPC